MVNSILTNYNSMVALQNLQSTQKMLSQVQNSISTGLAINSAKDNAATWAVATTMKANVANMKEVSSLLSTSDSIVGTAVKATNTLTDLISQIKSKLTDAQSGAVNSTQVQGDIDQLLAQINDTTAAASYNGANLLNSASPNKFLSSVNTDSTGASVPAYITVAGHDLSTSGELSMLTGLSVVSRGDQLFTTAVGSTLPSGVTAAQQASMGTRGLSFNVTDNGGAGTSLAAATTPTSSSTYTVSYTDASGNSRTLTTAAVNNDGTVASLIKGLNADSTFSSMFYAGGSSGSFTVAAAERAEETGSFKITGIAANNAAVLAAVTPHYAESTMTFQDGQSLNLSDKFVFSYKANSTTVNKVTLQVTNDATGTIEATDGSGNYTISVKLDEVNKTGILGSDIVAAFKNALTGATTASNTVGGWYVKGSAVATVAAGSVFNAAAVGAAAATGNIAVTDTAVGGSATNNTLTLSSFAGSLNTDDIVSVQAPQTDYSTLLTRIDAANTAVINAATAFGSAQKRIESQKTFVDNLADTLTAGVGNMVDADMSTESARLTALQVQQQLGTQALSIANQQPQNILSLFK